MSEHKANYFDYARVGLEGIVMIPILAIISVLALPFALAGWLFVALGIAPKESLRDGDDCERNRYV